jgi:hypothetical protein
MRAPQLKHYSLFLQIVVLIVVSLLHTAQAMRLNLRSNVRTSTQSSTGLRTLARLRTPTVLIRTADINKPGSTTAPRSGDGDRPPGRPRRGEARSAE